ncbi:MAG TPA: PAS domain-containing sensor histidine kinase [Chloroflexota bacterium]|nr:PAS domain-containing sensor histidine kinase [Chloroflexota bacterium]
MASEAVLQPISRAVPVLRVAVPALALVVGLGLLVHVGAPPSVTDALAFAAAVVATELLLLDFPDRRGVSTAALPVVLAAAAGEAVAVWAAALGTLAASAALRRPLGQSLLYFGRAALAAWAAGLAASAVPFGQLGRGDPIAGGAAAVVGVAVFAAVSEVVTLAEVVGPRGRESHVDFLASVALAPIAAIAWTIQGRAGDNALAAVGGGLLGLLAVVRSAINVSTHHAELRLAYDLVERERQKLSTLLAHSGEGIFLVGPDGCLAQVNHELHRLTGRTEADSVGRPIEEALPMRLTSGELLEVALQRVRPGSPLQAEATLHRDDGRRVDVLLSYAVVPSSDAAYGGIGIVRDITAMKNAQRERDDFVAVMTHDLRQPLTGLLGYAQLIERGTTPEKTKRFAQGIRRGGEQMLRMINNLLELARLESGEMEIQVGEVQLRRLVEEVVQSLDGQIAEKRIELRLDLPLDLPTLRSSETLLRECLANLVGNAVKYTPDGGQVAVSARAERDHLVVAVADTGIGIPRDDFDRLFSRFFRSSQQEVRKLRGSGLGLALTKTMIERLGGSIAVESELGKGTTFTMTLPLETELKHAA